MALIDISSAGISIKDIKTELGGDFAGVSFGDKAFPDETEKLLRIPNVANAESVDHSQILLPRVFPVFT